MAPDPNGSLADVVAKLADTTMLSQRMSVVVIQQRRAHVERDQYPMPPLTIMLQRTTTAAPESKPLSTSDVPDEFVCLITSNVMQGA